MRIVYSKTGSTGNCSVIESSSGGKIIIDCGLKYDKVNRKVGYTLHKASAVLVTHCHGDHTAHLKDFFKTNVNILMNAETLAQAQKQGHIKALTSKSKVKVLSYKNQYEYGDFIVKPFPLKHTSYVVNEETGIKEELPCDCSGFLIFEKATKEKLLWITDTSYVESTFPPMDYICIECNYFEQENYADEIQYINEFVEKRRLKSHLSFETCKEFLNLQNLSKCKEIRLLHLSSTMQQEDKEKVAKMLRNELYTKNIEVKL